MGKKGKSSEGNKGRKSKTGEKKVKEEKSSDQKVKESKESKPIEPKGKKHKARLSKKEKEERTSSDDYERGFEVELDMNEPYPTEEDLKRFGPLSLEAKQAHTAIVLLESEEEHVLIESLNSLQRFTNKCAENRELFILLRGLDAIWKFFFHEHLVMQRLALKILAIVCVDHKTKLLVRDYQFADDLVKLMKSDDPVILEYVTSVAKRLTQLFSGRIQIIRNEAVPDLISLTEHPDADIKNNCIEAICNLLEEPLHIEFFTSSECVRSIYNLVDSEYSAIQIQALAALEKLTRRSVGVSALKAVEIIPNFQYKLEDRKFGDIHRACLRILLNIAEDSSNCEKMSTLLNQLVIIMDDSKDLRLLILTVNLVEKLARIQSLAKTLVNNHEIVPKLILIVSTYSDPELREAGAFAAAQIAASDFIAKRLLIPIFKPLRAFFFDIRATLTAREHILLACSFILEESEEAGKAFIQSGGIQMLVHACGDRQSGKYSDDAVLSALNCINTLGLNRNFREAMVDDGLVPAVLIQLISPNPQVLTLALNALGSLLCVEKGRQEFIEQAGYVGLIKAARDPDLNVVVSLTPLINAIGSYPEICEELVNKGLMTTIWERGDLLASNGPLRVALNRLITNHLPAKYAYTGHIGPYEKLPAGFYDAGYVRKGEVFIPLEEMRFEEREKYQAVIYVNFDSEVNPKITENSPILLSLQNEETQSVLNYAAQVRELIPDNVRSEKDLVGLLATVVCAKMGGTLDKWRVSAYTEDIELADFQNKHASVVVPLTLMNNGAHRPRALFFKALADIFGIPCSLDRGGFKKCWNVVQIRAKKMHICCASPDNPDDKQDVVFTERLRRFVVDLIYSPGSLFPIYSYEADTYCFN